MRSIGLEPERDCKDLASLRTEPGQLASVSRNAQDKSRAEPAEDDPAAGAAEEVAALGTEEGAGVLESVTMVTLIVKVRS